jgi:hypothetical protein
MLNWSQTRLLATLIAATVVTMEPVSWLTFGIPPCIVNPKNYGTYYTESNECPTFHVFLFKFLASIFEVLGDPNWVVAIFTIVLAVSTIGLWIATIFLYRAGEEQIAIARLTAEAAKAAADEAIIANATSRAQIQANIAIPVDPKSKIKISKDRKITVSLNLVNNGGSVARSIEIQVEVIVRTERELAPEI